MSAFQEFTKATVTSQFIEICNDGKKLTWSNFWDTEMAQKGILLLSWNAGEARLLVPDSQIHNIPEMKSGKFVIVSRGPWAAKGYKDGLEILFEDFSDSPFCLHLSLEQIFPLVRVESGHKFGFSVYTRKGLVFQRPGKFRKVPRIPYLQSWGS